MPPTQFWVNRPAEMPGDYWEPRIDPDGNERTGLTDADRLSSLALSQRELEFLNACGPGSILDYGCGPGWLLQELEGWECYYVEPSERCRNALQFLASPFVWDRQVDVVRCHHVIEHVPNPMTCMEQLHRACKPGGWFLFGTPDFGGPSAVKFKDRYRMMHDPTHRNLFTNESAHRFLRSFGWIIEAVDYPYVPTEQLHADVSDWLQGARSVAWPGNWITFYCRKREGNE